jgi:hypothetical protein
MPLDSVEQLCMVLAAFLVALIICAPVVLL